MRIKYVSWDMARLKSEDFFATEKEDPEDEEIQFTQFHQPGPEMFNHKRLNHTKEV